MNSLFRVLRVATSLERTSLGAAAAEPPRRSRTRGLAAAALSIIAAALLGAPAPAQQGAAANEVEEVDGLMWSLETNGESVPWDAANEYCDTLEHAGFDDWRLPTLFELESLHDPSAESGLRAPFDLDDCCAWSATTLVDLPTERKGVLPDPLAAPENYYWGFLFANGIRYYSLERFPDGSAMCVRD